MLWSVLSGSVSGVSFGCRIEQMIQNDTDEKMP